MPFFSGEQNGLIYLSYEVPEDIDPTCEVEIDVFVTAHYGGYGDIPGEWFIKTAPSL